MIARGRRGRLRSAAVSETSFPTEFIVNAVVSKVGRGTLPFQQAHTGGRRATAFWYNDLVEQTAEDDYIRQYLVTAAEATRCELADFQLRAELCRPEMSAERLLMPDFEGRWITLPGLGVAVMPTDDLYRHAARKGWEWSTDEVTEGIAATATDLSRVAAGGTPALVLGHDVGPEGARLQAVAVGAVGRDAEGALRWDRAMPEGCVGAPVFTGLPVGDDGWKLVCLGVVLPGPRFNVVAPFDRIRDAVRALPR